jgi:hypothetical protein
MDTALELFAANRASNVELLRLAGGEARSRPYLHAQFGEMTLGNLIDHTAHHDMAHMNQITRG